MSETKELNIKNQKYYFLDDKKFSLKLVKNRQEAL